MISGYGKGVKCQQHNAHAKMDWVKIGFIFGHLFIFEEWQRVTRSPFFYHAKVSYLNILSKIAYNYDLKTTVALFNWLWTVLYFLIVIAANMISLFIYSLQRILSEIVLYKGESSNVQI